MLLISAGSHTLRKLCDQNAPPTLSGRCNVNIVGILIHQQFSDLVLQFLIIIFSGMTEFLDAAAYDSDQLVYRDGFAQIVLYSQFQCFSGIFKIIISAEYDSHQFGIYLFSFFNHFKTINMGHSYVSHKQIGLLFLQKTDAVPPVFCRSYNGYSQALPVNYAAKPV